MKDDEELESLLGEIPHAISFNLSHIHHLKQGNGVDHHQGRPFMTPKVMNGMICGLGMYNDAAPPLSLSYHHNKHSCDSPVSGFSLQSDGSSSSLFSSGHSLSDNGSPTTPPLEDLKPHSHSGSTHFTNGLWMDMRSPDSYLGKKANENVIDELSLSRNLSRLYINEEPEDVKFRGNCGTNGFDFDPHGLSSPNSKSLSDYGRYQFDTGNHINADGEIGSAMLGLVPDYRLGNLIASHNTPGRASELLSRLNGGNGAVMNPQYFYAKRQAGHHYVAFPVSDISTLPRPSMGEAFSYVKQNGSNAVAENDAFHVINVPQLNPLKSQNSVENVIHYQQQMANACSILPSRAKVAHRNLESLSAEESLIMQGENVSYAAKNGYDRSKNQKNYPCAADVSPRQEKQSVLNGHPQIAGTHESDIFLRPCGSFSLPLKCDSLAQAQGYIYCIAKDQHGCRFLQRMFDEGTPHDVHIIFNEVIDHVVELMMNPFGNYLMQKLLEVCNEEQRMQILLRVTAKPGELIRISLNTHGTRVVQKLIETLKSRKQISLVIKALEPGFLALIKDLNGNHVVQRCLQCLSSEDSKFIFIAAAKYCVDIATHQHGCCVLQRCISHSGGEHRESLIAEISANALFLAQDAFGNYVVQFILELKIPSATSKLTSQFEGNYVHLSTQKFSSHVVEKCLVTCNNEVRSKIIHEMLAATHFEQLLQDPHANYVVQTALKVSEGHLHNVLVDAIESHKAMSRNSPYSKRIFSHKLLKK
ncbi:OLC1v1002615C1 [Oldenlandia corymbosa var. corymbosa]|uniref:OLC1v1002615C1 n=1 Tax=Oldenlandia corymbosa var. corymbosa TaxID=529605 RepID=A0AAV1DAZ5_OLDCO|nr:OLC1v1002615C1 [Oldenlandia corymbosa var. corymbosa]